MKIGIDVRLLGEAGLGRYIEQTISNLEDIDKENQYYIFLTKKNFRKYNFRNPNFKKVKANYKWYTIKEQILFPILLNKYNLDLVHFPHFNVPILYNKPFITTIHDLIVLKFPTIRATKLSPLKYKTKKVFLKFILKNTIKKSKNIIAISEFTKNDIVSYFNLSKKLEDKITVIYEGVTGLNKNVEIGDQIKNEVLKLKPYIIYVGSAYPHKNLEMLCEAFKDINDLNLVLVGKKNFFYDRLENEYKELINKKIFLTGYLDDNVLDFYLKNALFYIFPSLYEGFGLPPLEAMRCSVPVLSSNASCMPEILKDSVEYFNPKDKESIKNSINKLKDNKTRLEELKTIGNIFYRRYSWLDSAKNTFEIYKKSIK